MSELLQIMGALREAGAVGGMVFDPSGRILEHTMPSFFPAASLRAAGERTVVFYETVAENFEPLTEMVLAFEGYTLLLRRAPEIWLVVVMSDASNREAVKMASNLVFRRLVAASNTAAPRVIAAGRLPPPAPSPTSVRIPESPKPAAPQRPAAANALPPKTKKKNDIWGD